MLELHYIYDKKTLSHKWAIRKRLYEMQSGHCHYCGRFMEKPVKIDMIGKDRPVKLSMCTVEHLDPKPMRMSLDPYVERVVAACYSCNQKMNTEFVKTPLAQMYAWAVQLAEQQDRVEIDVFPVPKGWLVPKPPKVPKGEPIGRSMRDRIERWQKLNGRCGCCGKRMLHPMQNRSSKMQPEDPVRDPIHRLVHNRCKVVIDQSKAGLQINPV